MKRAFITICAAIVATLLAQCTTFPQKSWQVGDIYEVNGVKGVVFAVTNDGKHGRVISFEETYANYDDAVAWAQSLGEGWRLPNYDEVKIIGRKILEINEQLYLLNQEQIYAGFLRNYWFGGAPDSNYFIMYVGNSRNIMGEILEPDTVWYVSFGRDELEPEYIEKSSTEFARAVYEF